MADPDSTSAATTAPPPDGIGHRRQVLMVAAAALCLLFAPGRLVAQSTSTAGEVGDPKAAPLDVPAQWLRLAKDYDVWIDPRGRRVIVGGMVCLREGQLEMFACPKQTKEHEAVVSVNSPARFVHAGLVALGARQGSPVQFEPEYKPASGTKVKVEVVWRDEHGKRQQVPAQQWVKHVKTGKALEYPWVFVGSGFWTDERSGERFYYADGGEFICVSNFPTAMLDLPVESSQANESLMFCAFTEHIPPRRTPVQLILTPELPKRKPSPPRTADPGEEAKAKDAPDTPKESGESKEPGKQVSKKETSG